MKKAKTKAIIWSLVFALLVAGGVYTVLFGLGKENAGKANKHRTGT